MSTLTIEIGNTSNKMWYEERHPEQKKQKLKTPKDEVKLKGNSGMQFVFYSKDNNTGSKKPATYEWFRIENPVPKNVNISIQTSNNELITEITWPNYGKQKSKYSPSETPDNVNVGVKE